MNGEGTRAVSAKIVIVTTSHRAHPETEVKARHICADEGWRYIARDRATIPEMICAHGVPGILVVGADTMVYWTAGGQRLFFHPGLAKTRVRAIQYGQQDSLITALDLKPGDTVVDANLGIATDALVMASVTRARILGIEIDPVIAFLTRTGLKSYPFQRYFPEGTLLAQHIEVIQADHARVLRELPDRSFEAVHFSPMFVKPRKKCDDRMPLREVAEAGFVSPDALFDAFRVARKRVAIKVNRDRPPMASLPHGYEVISGRRAYAQYIVYRI
ncbi:MAG: class I SAM-dependent methyltransferase [bacterium JZ-2024 1]